MTVSALPNLPRSVIILLLLLPFGCTTPPSEFNQTLRIPAGQYQSTFAEATKLLRWEGHTPALRDPRRGVIETESRIAGSLFEPGRNHHTSFSQTIENTLALQRERIRLEFSPLGEPKSPGPPGSDPDLLALSQPLHDLTKWDGEIELRVFVFLDRAHQPGLRRNTWTRTKTTRTLIYPPEVDPDVAPRPLPALTWTPLSRDPAAEARLHRLLARVGQDSS